MDGLFQTTADVTNHTSLVDGENVIIQPDAKPGDVKFIDQDDNGILDDEDKIELGDPNPDFVYGISFSCNYKAFDFSAIPQYHITKISIKSDSCMRCKISQKDDHCKNVSNDRVFTNKDLPFSSRT